MKYSISQQKLQRKNVFIAHFLQRKNVDMQQKLQQYSQKLVKIISKNLIKSSLR